MVGPLVSLEISHQKEELSKTQHVRAGGRASTLPDGCFSPPTTWPHCAFVRAKIQALEEGIEDGTEEASLGT